MFLDARYARLQEENIQSVTAMRRTPSSVYTVGASFSTEPAEINKKLKSSLAEFKKVFVHAVSYLVNTLM